MHRFIPFVLLFVFCELRSYANIIINDADCVAGTYTFSMNYIDLSNQSKFYNSVYKYKNVMVNSAGAGSSQRNCIVPVIGTPTEPTTSAQFEFAFDFSNTYYTVNSFKVSDFLYDQYVSGNYTSITTQWSTDEVNWHTISTVTTALNSGTQIAQATNQQCPTSGSLSAVAKIYYLVTFTGSNSGFTNTETQWNPIANPQGTAPPFSVVFNLSDNSSAQTITPISQSVHDFITSSYISGSSTLPDGKTPGVVIPAGTYPIPSSGSVAHLTFQNMKNFTIEAASPGVVFQMANPAQGSIQFNACDQVTLSGPLALVRPAIPTSQGVVQNISTSNNTVDVTIDQDYPGYNNTGNLINNANFAIVPVLNVFDATTGKLKADSVDVDVASYSSGTDVGYPIITQLGTDEVEFQCSNVSASGVQIGDKVAWRGTVRGDVSLVSCTNMTVNGVTIAGGSGFCFQEIGGGNNTYENDTITYPPLPNPTEDPAPLLASNADGLNSAATEIGPNIINCNFACLDDDDIAIHGYYSLTAQDASGSTVIIDNPHPASPVYPGSTTYPLYNSIAYKIGDTLTFYDLHNEYEGQAVIQSVSVLPSSYTPAQSFPPSYNNYYHSMTVRNYYQITVSPPISALTNWAVGDNNLIGSGFKVNGCSITSGRGRAMLIKASSGTITGNLMVDNAQGMEVDPELNTFAEADYASNLVISGNTFINMGSNRADHLAALAVSDWEINPSNTSTWEFVPLPGGHNNVTIDQNTFKNDNAVNILISSTQKVTIEDNNFINPMTTAVWSVGTGINSTSGVDESALIWLTEDNGVTISDNFVGNAGTQMQTSVATGTDVSGDFPDLAEGNEAVACFDGGNGTTTDTDSYPGDLDPGWAAAWGSLASTGCTISGNVEGTSPLKGDTANYLEVTGTTTDIYPCTAAIYRQLDTSGSDSIDLASPHQVAFDVRPEGLSNGAGGMRYVIYDRSSPANQPDQVLVSWEIETDAAGNWAFYNGDGKGDGTGSFVESNPPMPATSNTVYHFAISVTPGSGSTASTWSATVSIPSVSNTPVSSAISSLGFRTSTLSDGSYLEFGGNNSTAGAGTFKFSIDSVMVASQLTEALSLNMPQGKSHRACATKKRNKLPARPTRDNVTIFHPNVPSYAKRMIWHLA